MRSNAGRHTVAVIDDTVHERMALYDELPRELRDTMKDLAFNYSPVSMREWAEKRGVDAVRDHMHRFDHEHWRTFFHDSVGDHYD